MNKDRDIELMIFISAMRIKILMGTKFITGVIDVLRIRRNYWSFSIMK